MPAESQGKGQTLRWVVIAALLAGLVFYFVNARPGGGAIFRPCATTAVPAGGVAVPAGAVAVPITVPPGAIAPGTTCAAGDTVTTPGAVCGIVLGGYTCKDTYNTTTGACSAECM